MVITRCYFPRWACGGGFKPFEKLQNISIFLFCVEGQNMNHARHKMTRPILIMCNRNETKLGLN
jgi:hypothetical protein